MPFHLFVAWRYLRGAQGREGGDRFLRFVSLVAISGVAIGVATLLLALAIVRGFSQEIQAKIIGFGAHVQVENVRHAPLDGAQELISHIRSRSEVASLQPVVSEFALLRRSSTEIEGINLWGTNSLPAYLKDEIIQGNGEFAAGDREAAQLIIGHRLATDLGLSIGDRVTLLSTRNLQGATILGARPRFRQFEIGSIYETSLADFDETYAFADISVARELLNYASDEVTRIDVTLHDVQLATNVARSLEEELGVAVLARTIFEIYRGLFAWVNLQEAIIPLVIGVLIVVAAFNIMGALLMLVLEKTREIGVLAAMGATRFSIRRLYTLLGLLIGSTGTVIGLVLALACGLIQLHYGIITLPADAYYMSIAPVALRWTDFALVASVSLILCGASSYLPARFASHIDPIRVIRFS